MCEETKLVIKLSIVWILAVLAVISINGCYQDMNGGWRLGTNEANSIEQGLDVAKEGLGLLSIFIPGAAGLAGIATGVAGAFKKMRPELTKQKKVNEHTIFTIEWVKENMPEVWEKIKGKFAEETDADIEDVIAQYQELYSALNEIKNEESCNGNNLR